MSAPTPAVAVKPVPVVVPAPTPIVTQTQQTSAPATPTLWNKTKQYLIAGATSIVTIAGIALLTLSSNYSFGAVENKTPPNATAFEVTTGKTIGNTLTLVGNVAEMAGGGGLALTGVTALPLAFAGAPATGGVTLVLDGATIAKGGAIAAHGAGVALYTVTKGGGTSGGVNASPPAIERSNLPENAQNTLNQLEKNNFQSPPQGYKGGGVFENKEGYLPRGEYKEWDVAPSVGGRNAQRFVSDTNGNVYWTETHYGDKPGVPFYKVK